MKAEKSKIAAALEGDTTLLNMLASNKPYYDPNGALAKVNSIIPAGKANGDMNMPFVTVKVGSATKIGYKFGDQVFYIRAYDSKERSYISIEEILERIKTLLDNYTLSFTNYGNAVPVKLKYEGSLPEQEDQPLDLNFGENIFRLYSI